MQTKSSEIPLPPLTPANLTKIGASVEAISATALSVMLIEMLKAHSDPIVVKAASELQELCVRPWATHLLTENALTADTPDVYDLTLLSADDKHENGRLKHVGIGSADTNECHIAVDGIASWHVKIETIECEGEETTWKAELGSAGHDNPVIRMKVGDEVATQTRERHSNPIMVKPGDVIEIGLHHIRLHEPVPKEAVSGITISE